MGNRVLLVVIGVIAALTEWPCAIATLEGLARWEHTKEVLRG